MAQFARPDADTTTGSWASTPLYEKIDETSPIDSVGEYISGASGDKVEFELSPVTNPVTNSDHIVRIRLRVFNEFNSGSFRVELIQIVSGTTTVITLQDIIVSNTLGEFNTYAFTLDEEEAALITNYGLLSIRCEDYSGGGVPIFATYDMSWLELEVPDVVTRRRTIQHIL